MPTSNGFTQLQQISGASGAFAHQNQNVHWENPRSAGHRWPLWRPPWHRGIAAVDSSHWELDEWSAKKDRRFKKQCDPSTCRKVGSQAFVRLPDSLETCPNHAKSVFRCMPSCFILSAIGHTHKNYFCMVLHEQPYGGFLKSGYPQLIHFSKGFCFWTIHLGYPMVPHDYGNPHMNGIGSLLKDTHLMDFPEALLWVGGPFWPWQSRAALHIGSRMEAWTHLFNMRDFNLQTWWNMIKHDQTCGFSWP